MEDYKIDILIESGPNARTVQINLEPFTLLGQPPVRVCLLRPCGHDLESAIDCNIILQNCCPRSWNEAQNLKCSISQDAAIEIAGRSRGTPRISNGLLRRVSDFAQIKGNGTIDMKITQYALKCLQVDAHGLDEMDNKILTTLIDKFKGGPVGITTLATAVSENAETIEEVYEPFLIQQGFIVRTPRGT